MGELTFEKPGPGTWQLEDAHFSGPFSTWMQEVFPPAMKKGFGQTMAEYGALLDEPEIEPVNGFIYISLRPVVGPVEASDPPPKVLFKLLTWVHPTLRRRLARMEETFERKRWRRDLARWDEEIKPQRIRENDAIQAVDPTELTDEELLEHVEHCRETTTEAIVIHHRFDLCPLLPMGDFLAHVTEWTDCTPGELLGLFDGATPISLRGIDELQTLATRVRERESARELVFSDENPGDIVERLWERSDDIGDATGDWLEQVGYLPVSGYDVADFYALEKPSVLVNILRGAVDGHLDAGIEYATDERLDEIRDEIPEEHWSTFDDLYEEAKVTYRIRDERTIHDLWTLGLTRRALLEVGRRLADRDLLHEPDHVVDLAPDEITAVLRDGGGPSADEVAGRVQFRRTYDNDDAPGILGPDPAPPPPAEWLPEGAARGMRAIEMVLENLLEPGEEASEAAVIRGLGASSGTYEGPARIISGPEDFEKIQEGDVLVAETTSPAFNVVLPLLGGVVTDNGGVLSHAAIVAREFDIPGVVGCTDATDRLEDGTPVLVDGRAGTVQIRI